MARVTTSHEKLLRFKGKSNNGSSGYRAYQGGERAWCYLCGASHAWAVPCEVPPNCHPGGGARHVPRVPRRAD